MIEKIFKEGFYIYIVFDVYFYKCILVVRKNEEKNYWYKKIFGNYFYEKYWICKKFKCFLKIEYIMILRKFKVNFIIILIYNYFCCVYDI